MENLFLGVLCAVSFSAFVYYGLDVMAGSHTVEYDKLHKRLESLIVNRKTTLLKTTDYSAIPKLNKIFKRQKFSQNLNYLLTLSGWNIPLSIFVLSDMMWGVVVGAIAQALSRSQAVGLAVGLMAMFLPYMVLVNNRKKYINNFIRKFPDALSMMKNALRAGQSIQAAFQMVASEGPKPVSTEFEKMVREIQIGSKFNEALSTAYQRIPSTDFRIFMLGVFIQQEIGGNLGELLAQIEKTIRERISLILEMNALTAQGKFTGMMLSFMPFAVAGMLSVVNPDYLKPLLEPEGRKIIVIGVVMQVIGALIIRKMTKITVLQ